MSDETTTFRERRQLGLTIANVRDQVKALQGWNGPLADELSLDTSTAAAQVLARIVAANPEAYRTARIGQPGAVDWDVILDFIERLIELILKFFPLFV